MFNGLGKELACRCRSHSYWMKSILLSKRFYKSPVIFAHLLFEGFCLWYFAKIMHSSDGRHKDGMTLPPNLIERCTFKIINKLEFWTRKVW